MLTFSRDEDLKKIFDIKNILYTRVKIEELRTNPEIVKQCKKCQSFGHTKNYCRSKEVCVKCAGKHNSNKCPRGKHATPKCANCKQEGHVASYRGCPVTKKAQQARDNVLKALKIKNQNQKKNSTKAQVIAGVIRDDPINQVTLRPTENRNYAQTVTNATTKKTKYNEQQRNQAADNSIKTILRQILNNQENFEKRLSNIENNIKMFTNKNG